MHRRPFCQPCSGSRGQFLVLPENLVQPPPPVGIITVALALYEDGFFDGKMITDGLVRLGGTLA